MSKLEKIQLQKKLIDACFFGRSNEVKRILETNIIEDVNIFDEGGWSPLYSASNEAFYDIAQLLISHKADTNITSNKLGPPLPNVAFRNDYRMAKLLIDNGANMDEGTELCWSAMYMACWHGRKEIVQLFLDKGASPDGDMRE